MCETDGIAQVSNVYEKHKGNHFKASLDPVPFSCYQFNTKSLNLLKINFSKIILFHITIHSTSELDIYILVLIS